MNPTICALCGDSHPDCDHVDNCNGTSTPVCPGCAAELDAWAAETIAEATDYQLGAEELPPLPWERGSDPRRHGLVRALGVPANDGANHGEAA